jgi:CDGSH-type Zn-finger protein
MRLVFQPFCDGSNKLARDEEDGKLYSYENGERKEVNGSE